MPFTSHPARARRGITLVEVIAALVLVTVGMLGIAGSSALMLRAVTAQDAEHRAVRQASLRIAALMAGGCAAAADGLATHDRGLREWWFVSAVVNGARTVRDSLEWTSGGRGRRLVVRSGMLC